MRRQPCLQYTTGENHPFAGKMFTLRVFERAAPPQVHVRDTHIVMYVRPGADRYKRAAILDAWYRRQLYAQVPALLEKWEPRIGERASEVRIRKMKTRWGSCNPSKRRIWLSLYLAHRSPSDLEYVMVHELAHFVQRGHPPQFWRLMNKLLPDWPARKNAMDRRFSTCGHAEGDSV